MRSETHGGITVEYPEYLTYIGDDNIVRAYKQGAIVQLGVAVGSSWNNNGVYYESDLGEVTFNISQLLRAQAIAGEEITLTFYIGSRSETYSFVFSQTFYLSRGRSLIGRYNGTGHVVFVPSWDALELPVIESGAKVICGNFADYPDVGVYRMSTGDLRGTLSSVEVTYENEQKFGTVENTTFDHSTYFEVHQLSCIPEDCVLLRWIDADGCRRFIVGKLAGKSAEVVQRSYRQSLAGVPARRVSDVQRVITIGLTQVTADMWLEDIAYSEDVAIVNLTTLDELPLVPNFTEIAINAKGQQDLTLEFIMQI